ncbi:family 16 glycoside hydrolase [Candidatus Viridilinea mediisalina]|uniref:3-keto-alpha-glucoside-1,2-lyase/3-keto-2-hydroxy-glucal hydratase domain-containing protein n=1 Tax=Candidatus Viridilinea mediisalina TaxID=2024553 RepID=A0A2A6RLL4_9CHLR|nr:family 16 glycoside hydrolase [Candidatus Viridilinea mediisalina]PDW03730.1 hypothetical protein CJ255_07430 [Candidatus Viridilinea mediisalina]
MKSNQRQRNLRPLIAGMTGFTLMIILGLFLSLSSFQRQGQAQSDSPIFQLPDYTPTPTVPPQPTSAPVLAEQLLLKPELDRPEALEAWEFVDVGMMLPEDRSVWKIEEGALHQDRTAAAGNPNTYETMAFIGDPTWSDYTVRMRFHDQGNGNVGLVVRRQAEDFYRLRLLADIYSDTPKIMLERVVDGVVTPLATLDEPGYELRLWNELSLSVSGDQLQASLNGEPILVAEDSTLTNGQAGIFTRAMGKIRFSDVMITE